MCFLKPWNIEMQSYGPGKHLAYVFCCDKHGYVTKPRAQHHGVNGENSNNQIAIHQLCFSKLFLLRPSIIPPLHMRWFYPMMQSKKHFSLATYYYTRRPIFWYTITTTLPSG